MIFFFLFFSLFRFVGEKPYACPVCPRAFNQRVVLREHIRSHHSQPDPNYEDSLMPFYCTVCGNLFKTSQEIIQHLIEHSDANTVSNRQPVVCFIAIHISLYIESQQILIFGFNYKIKTNSIRLDLVNINGGAS